MKPLLLIAGLLCALPVCRAAEAEAEPAAEPVLHPPGWLLPAPKIQMDMDAELIPVGRGAIFAPAMSESPVEPPFLVMHEGELVQRAAMGKKVIVPPGKYTVLVGSGVEGQMSEHQLEVFEGHCTLVEPDWAGMMVHVVDERGVQVRGTYEVFELPSGEDYGLGLGADESRGEVLRTWLLKPGRYMITAAGESPRARTDFLTVRLEPGELVQFTLVQDSTTGHFLGGGQVDRWEGHAEIKKWRLGLIIGGDLLWHRNDQVVAVDFGNSITFDAFLDWSMRYLDPHHLVYARLQMEEGQTSLIGKSLSDMHLQKTIDEVKLDALYTYRVLSWLGPYVRFGVDTNLFPGKTLFQPKQSSSSPDQTVIVLDNNLSEIKHLTNPTELGLAYSLDPVEFKEGTGVAFDLIPSLMFDIHLRVGFGAQQYLVQSLLVAREKSPTDPVVACQDANTSCYDKKVTSELLGIEATLIGSARLWRFLQIDTELDTLMPFHSSEGSNDPVIDWKNTISLRLVSFASLAYVVRMEYNTQLSTHLQVEQRILLRFTFDIL